MPRSLCHFSQLRQAHCLLNPENNTTYNATNRFVSSAPVGHFRCHHCNAYDASLPAHNRLPSSLHLAVTLTAVRRHRHYSLLPEDTGQWPPSLHLVVTATAVCRHRHYPLLPEDVGQLGPTAAVSRPPCSSFLRQRPPPRQPSPRRARLLQSFSSSLQ